MEPPPGSQTAETYAEMQGKRRDHGLNDFLLKAPIDGNAYLLSAKLLDGTGICWGYGSRLTIYRADGPRERKICRKTSGGWPPETSLPRPPPSMRK